MCLLYLPFFLHDSQFFILDSFFFVTSPSLARGFLVRSLEEDLARSRRSELLLFSGEV